MMQYVAPGAFERPTTDQEVAHRSQTRLLMAQRAFLDGITHAVQTLPAGEVVAARPVASRRQEQPNSCFLAGVIACTGSETPPFKEAGMLERLTKAGLVPAGVSVDPATLPGLNAILETELNVHVRDFRDIWENRAGATLFPYLLGRAVVSQVTEHGPILVKHQPDAYGVGHWRVLASVENAAIGEKWYWMNPSQGAFEVSDSDEVMTGFMGPGSQTYVSTAPSHGFELLDK